MFGYAWLILLFPMVGFVGLSLYGDRIPRYLTGPAGCATIGLSFLVTLVAFSDLVFMTADKQLGHVHVLYPWIVSGSFQLFL